MNPTAREVGREYSTAFDKLVATSDEDADIVGLLAYALYKRNKRELALQSSPDDSLLRNHHRTLTPSLVAQYRETALRDLEAFSDKVVIRAEPEIKASARVEEIETARDAVIAQIRSSTAWWLSIVWNVVAWLISLAIVFLVTVGSGKVSLQISP